MDGGQNWIQDLATQPRTKGLGLRREWDTCARARRYHGPVDGRPRRSTGTNHPIVPEEGESSTVRRRSHSRPECFDEMIGHHQAISLLTNNFASRHGLLWREIRRSVVMASMTSLVLCHFQTCPLLVLGFFRATV